MGSSGSKHPSRYVGSQRDLLRMLPPTNSHILEITVSILVVVILAGLVLYFYVKNRRKDEGVQNRVDIHTFRSNGETTERSSLRANEKFGAAGFIDLQ